jgi:alkanesulfonate monooxygenase SsuD/methylene tetrahydromethanopterin reductase-like flavin-dependent oxidoreductase (luciferase family)
MKFGVTDHMDRASVPLSQQYDDRLRLYEACDKSGWIYCVHINEHHGTPLGTAPSPSVFLSAIAQRTKTINIGTSVFTLAMYNPYRLFDEICMLDQMSHGRMQLGVGRGISPIELGFMGVPFEDANEMYAEALEVLMRCFAAAESGGTMTFQGRHYRYSNVPIVLEPYQKPRPPLWYGIGSPDTAVWATEHNVNLLTNHTAASARVLHDRFVQEWALAKKDPAEMPFFGTSKHIVVADTDEEALALARPAHGRWIYHNTLLPRQFNVPKKRAAVEDFDEAIRMGIVFAGSPTTVRDGLVKFIEESGINYLNCRIAFGDLTFDQSKRTLDLLASNVFPDLADYKPATVQQ